jgi:nucleoid DNA-binding protein
VKKLYLSFLLIAAYSASSAQKYIPEIKEGTVLNYGVISQATGQQAVVALTIASLGDPIKINWNIQFVGFGSFEMSAGAMRSATKTIAEEPAPDEVTKLSDDRTVIVLSKDTYTSLVTTKSFKLNGYTFNVLGDTSAFKINNKDADVFHAVTTKGHRELWILNNPGFPLICKSQKVTGGIDYTLTGITNY